MLTAATLGLTIYGLYSVGAGLVDLLGSGPLEWWASLWLIVAGGTLVCSAVLVRASIPGGLALATAGLLALQSISLHNAGHLYGQVSWVQELARLVVGALLVGLAYTGWGRNPSPPA